MKNTFEQRQEELLAARLAGLLPRIDICGHPFIIDWRLRELRPENDFSTRIDLRNVPMSEDGEHYLFFYHVPTKSVVHIDENITSKPKDTVLVELPYELVLDPVAVARQYGLKDTSMLDDYPILENLKAKIIPVEETRLPELIKANREKQSRKTDGKRKGKSL